MTNGEQQKFTGSLLFNNLVPIVTSIVLFAFSFGVLYYKVDAIQQLLVKETTLREQTQTQVDELRVQIAALSVRVDNFGGKKGDTTTQ